MPGLEGGVCRPPLSSGIVSSLTASRLPLPDLVLACSTSDRSTEEEGPGLPKLVSLAICRRCRLAKGDDSGGEEGERCSRFDRGDVGKGMVPGAGEGDADGVDTDEEWRYGDSGVLLCPALGESLAFLNRFSSEYLDPSLRGALSARWGSGSASCPADRGLRELDEGTGRSS